MKNDVVVKKELCPGLHGHVRAVLLDRQGRLVDTVVDKDNVITFTAADIVAGVMAGRTDMAPNAMGFLYGTAASPSLTDPDALPLTTRRLHDWALLTNDGLAVTGNIAVCRNTMAPGVFLDSGADSSLYTANSVMYTANTGSVLECAFNGAGFADAIGDISGGTTVYFYHAILLVRKPTVSGATAYFPVARTTLMRGGTYPTRVSNRALAVYWTLCFE